jgi:hypothetical protein
MKTSRFSDRQIIGVVRQAVSAKPESGPASVPAN